MELFLKLAALATVAALLCVVLRQREKTMAVLLSLSACVLMFLLAVRMLAPIFEVAETIRDLTGLSSAVTAPLFKVTAIGLIGRIAAGVCSDAGEQALENAVELTTSILAVYAALPLLTAVLDLLQEMLGG